MRQPKALIDLAGLPLISYPLAAVEDAGLDPVVVAKADTPLPELTTLVVRAEPDEPRHPLAGIVAALHGSAGRPVVAVGCDMPLVTPELLRWLAELDAPAAVPELGTLQPLLARYSPEHAEPLEDALRNRTPLRDAVAALGPRIITAKELRRFGDPSRVCLNVNTPADLTEAERALSDARD